MGCCLNRDQKSSKLLDAEGEQTSVSRAPSLIVLHLPDSKPDVRIVRLLKCMLDLKGNTLEIKATKPDKLPGSLPIYPVLEYQGRTLSGEIPILQYVGRMEGFYPPMSHYDQYLTESLVSEVFDFWLKVSEDALESVFDVFPQVENRLPAGNRFFGGKMPSIADVVLFDFLRKNCDGDRRRLLPSRLSSFMMSCESVLPEVAKTP